MNKQIYLGLPISQISKIKIYEFWYDYVNLEHKEKAKLCYMDTNSFEVYIKTEDIYSDITKDVKTRSETSNFELDTPLPKGKNKS